MAQSRVSRIGGRIGHAFVAKPQTWPALIANLVVGSLLALLIWGLMNHIEMLRSPAPPVLPIAALCGVQVYDFVRRRRRDRARRRKAAQGPQ